MRIRNRRFTPRGPAGSVRPSLARRIRRLHPRCAVCWDMKRGGWVVVERTLQGQVALIAPLSIYPDMRVIDCLNESSQPRRMNRADYENWLENELDAKDRAAMAAGNAEFDAKLEEGHDRLWHEVGTDTMVAMGGSDGPETRSADPD